MAIFLVIYEPVRRDDMSLADFGQMLDQLGAPLKVLGTTWLVRTSGNPDWLLGEIKHHVGDGKHLLVAELDHWAHEELYPERMPLWDFLHTL